MSTRGHFLYYPKRVCAPVEGMVLRVLSRKRGIQFHRVASWTGCVFETKAFYKSVMVGDQRTSFMALTFRKILFHDDRSLLNDHFKILSAKQNESGSLTEVCSKFCRIPRQLSRQHTSTKTTHPSTPHPGKEVKERKQASVKSHYFTFKLQASSSCLSS